MDGMTDAADARAAFERALDKLENAWNALFQREAAADARAEVLRLWDAQRAAPDEPPKTMSVLDDIRALLDEDDALSFSLRRSLLEDWAARLDPGACSRCRRAIRGHCYSLAERSFAAQFVG